MKQLLSDLPGNVSDVFLAGDLRVDVGHWLRNSTCELKSWAVAEVEQAVRPTSTRNGGNRSTACMPKRIRQFMRDTSRGYSWAYRSSGMPDSTVAPDQPPMGKV